MLVNNLNPHSNILYTTENTYDKKPYHTGNANLFHNHKIGEFVHNVRKTVNRLKHLTR